MPFFKVGGMRKRWILGVLLVIALGSVVEALLPTRRNLSGISVTILKASPGMNGECDLELEIVNESGGEILIPAVQMPGSLELWMGESDRPLDPGRRHLLGPWVDGGWMSGISPDNQVLAAGRCYPTDLAYLWGTRIRLNAKSPERSLRARLHVLSPESVVTIAFVPLRQPGQARIWISDQLALLRIRTPDWLTGSRAQFLELHPPLIMGRVFGAQAQE